MSSIGKRTVRVTGKGLSVTPAISVTPIVSGIETARKASLATRLKRSLLPLLKGCAYLTKRRRMLILARLPFGTTRDWWWKGHTGS